MSRFGCFTLLTASWVAALPAAAQEPLAARVDAIFAEYDRPGSPGCALGVVRDGNLAYARGYGLANLEHNIPITPQTVFDIGSTSKQFTAASIALLAQDGTLSLNDPVRRWIPELPDYGETVTIRHLLNHTSGVRDYLTLMSLAGINFDGLTTAEEALDLIIRQRELNFAPGEQFLYSNSGYFLLSQIVERASGQTLQEFAEARIFDPLGMDDTHFHDDHTHIVPLRSTGHEPAGDDGFRIAMSSFEQTGDGALYTTVEDLALWDSNFYDPRVGGPPMLASMLTRGVLTSGDTLDYALGLFVGEYRGLPTVSHGGSWAGYRAELLRFPEQKLSAIVTCNLGSTDPGTLARQVAGVYLGVGMEEDGSVAPVTGELANVPHLPVAELERYAGVYRDTTTGTVRQFSVRDGLLGLDLQGDHYPAEAIATDRFRLEVAPLEFRFHPPGTEGVIRMKEFSGGSSTAYVRIEPADLSSQQLADYTGSYTSEEIDTEFMLRVEDGVLLLQRPGSSTVVLTPTVEDEFVTGNFILNFIRDTTGVIAFELDAGRTQILHFDRSSPSASQ